MRDFLTIQSAKTSKGEPLGYLTAILYLSPNTVSGRNVCPSSVPECRAACLATSGRMAMPTHTAKRLARTHLFFNNRPAFEATLISALHAAKRAADRRNLKLAFRPNGTSDLHFHKLLSRWPEIAAIPHVIYDYTKRLEPRPYHTTFSFSGSLSSAIHAESVLRDGGNVAAVYSTPKGRPLPRQWYGWPVIDGDLHDLRFLDPPGHIVGLRYKRIPGHRAADFPTFVQGVHNVP